MTDEERSARVKATIYLGAAYMGLLGALRMILLNPQQRFLDGAWLEGAL